MHTGTTTTAPTSILTGLTVAIGVNAVACLLTALLAHTFLRAPGTATGSTDLTKDLP